MRLIHAWLLAWLVALELLFLRRLPGWVVLCEDPHTTWHAMSGGEAYGMDHTTGRFLNRADAAAFCAMRNRECGDGSPYFVTHQRILSSPLPNTY